MLVNDIITHLNQHATRSLAQFKNAAALVIPGQTVHFTVVRNGAKLSIPVLTSEVDRAAFLPGTRHIHKVTLHNFTLTNPRTGGTGSPLPQDRASEGGTPTSAYGRQSPLSGELPIVPVRGRVGPGVRSRSGTPVSGNPGGYYSPHDRMRSTTPDSTWGSAWNRPYGRSGSRPPPQRSVELEETRADAGMLEVCVCVCVCVAGWLGGWVGGWGGGVCAPRALLPKGVGHNAVQMGTGKPFGCGPGRLVELQLPQCPGHRALVLRWGLQQDGPRSGVHIPEQCRGLGTTWRM